MRDKDVQEQSVCRRANGSVIAECHLMDRHRSLSPACDVDAENDVDELLSKSF